jgi:hypothetical protein
MEVRFQLHALTTLSLQKGPQYPFDRLGEPPEQVWTWGLREDPPVLAENQTLAIQPTVSHYTDFRMSLTALEINLLLVNQ